MHATPAVADGVTYFSGCDETVHGIRLADGQEIVTFPSGGYTGASMVLVDKRAYYGTFDNSVVGVDLVKQAVLWRYSPAGFPFYSSAAFGGDRIVVGGRDRLVHALDIKSGKAIWTFRTRARVDSSPAIAGGRVYVGSNDGRFYVLDSGEREEALGVRGSRSAVCLPGHRRGASRNRRSGRPPVLLRGMTQALQVPCCAGELLSYRTSQPAGSATDAHEERRR